MAIRVIDGVPGGGKSYYAVRHLAKNYFRKEKDGSYKPDKPCIIVTNIDGFKPDHITLKDAVEEAGGDHRIFFSNDYQAKFTEKYSDPIIYIIDEAQNLFRKNDRKLNDVFTYFEYHRHYGHDVYLITQNIRKLPPDISVLVEYSISATPRVRSLAGEFKYKWMSDGEKIKTEVFKPDKGVFALYKSMDAKESEKISNPVMKTVGIVVAAALLIGFGAYRVMVKKFSPDEPVTQTAATQQAKSSVSVPVPGAPARGSAAAVEITRIELSHIVQYNGNSASVIIVFNDAYYTMQDYPYNVLMIGSRLFSDVPTAAIKKKHESDKQEESTET